MRSLDGPTPGSAADDHVDADPEQVARTIVLRKLTAAPRSRADLRKELLKRGVPEDVCDRVLDRFAEVRLIDDEAYAQAWVESRHRSRGTARSVLRQELRAKGIDEELTAAALEEITDEDERLRARRLVEAKLRTLQRWDPDTRARRLVSMLVRRGYRQGMALSVVREVMGEESVRLAEEG